MGWLDKILKRGKKKETISEEGSEAPLAQQKWRGQEGPCVVCDMEETQEEKFKKYGGMLFHKGCLRKFKKVATKKGLTTDQAINDLKIRMQEKLHAPEQSEGEDEL